MGRWRCGGEAGRGQGPGVCPVGGQAGLKAPGGPQQKGGGRAQANSTHWSAPCRPARRQTPRGGRPTAGQQRRSRRVPGVPPSPSPRLHDTGEGEDSARRLARRGGVASAGACCQHWCRRYCRRCRQWQQWQQQQHGGKAGWRMIPMSTSNNRTDSNAACTPRQRQTTTPATCRGGLPAEAARRPRARAAARSIVSSGGGDGDEKGRCGCWVHTSEGARERKKGAMLVCQCTALFAACWFAAAKAFSIR